MPIGNLTSQMFANLYLDALDHHVKETLRVRHYLRYMDDFVLLVSSHSEARELLVCIEDYVGKSLRLALNPKRPAISPLVRPLDFLGYVHRAGRPIRVRRRAARRLWRRIPALQAGLEAGHVDWPTARSSLASWMGLAAYAHGFRLSRAVFGARDVRNLGKRLLVRSLATRIAGPSPACSTSRTVTTSTS